MTLSLSEIGCIQIQIFRSIFCAELVRIIMIAKKFGVIFRGSKGIVSSTIRKISSEKNDVILKEIGETGIIQLNRPKALNALNMSMVTKIYPALKDWENEKSLVIIKGTGEKAFCAGGDVSAVVEAGMKGNKQLGYDFMKREYQIIGLTESYKIPYIALIDGIVMGGGVGFSVHGRYQIATERTLFAMPETQIGLFPDVGGSHFLPRLNGRLGYYLALTGYRLKGTDVVKAGIASHFCESNKLPELEKELLNCSTENDIKDVLSKFSTKDLGEFSLLPVLDKIDHCFAPQTMEEIMLRIENDGSKWAKDTSKVLHKMSPTSLKVTLKQLELGKNMNLSDCLDMESILTINCSNNKDFYEGVRALLIDKDQNPKWDPPSLAEVSENLVNSLFSQVSNTEELETKL